MIVTVGVCGILIPHTIFPLKVGGGVGFGVGVVSTLSGGVGSGTGVYHPPFPTPLIHVYHKY